ncbi:putative ribosomal protein L34Ae [Helianthus annuus]|uniref:Ribosomal protein L34Ae n=1 Tax=Helianthus annuus TaxID=4232 RepID=A0A251S6K4_HELAN|nr:uncharacterized protein LOC110911017 [Helianthus annuus]KAF5763809.1 putative ribosomal protein L34Ae [Helianthus annuus]KAJ0450573.1 hypothetical protein HanHA300_Chr15g0557811 [Helianthus annuus]KAJ0454766.1 hypothetical protein HanIR_Chr15g0743781 [Helianthus annuus]KAJ0472425.1 hypothetical protein HanHA89_Chr15g0606921 [Helianthus annuus]KAJ0648026.1 hypothetical protein HanLR1_Chr15g0568281 [Helianthus annuus]
MDSVLEVFYPKLVLFVLGFWSFVSTCLLHLLRYFTRFTRKSGSLKGISSDSPVLLTKDMGEQEDVVEVSSEESDEKEDIVNEAHEFSFTFKFPTFEEFSKNPKSLSELLDNTGRVDSAEVLVEDSEVDTNSDGGVVSNESRVLEFEGSVHESHDDDQREGGFEQLMVDSSNLKTIEEVEEKEEIYSFSEEKLQKINVECVNKFFHSTTDSIGSRTSDVHSEDGLLSDKTEIAETEEKEDEEFDTFDEEKLQKVHDESIHSSPDSTTDSFSSNNRHSPMFDSHPDDGFLSDGDFEPEFDENDEKEQNNWTQSNFLSENDFVAKSSNEKNVSSDTTNKLESLWEHQELIEQLKMEIKKVKAIGLPTIFEESESPPKIMEDLKPWKIEEVYQNGGGKMGEVHKFYKSYRERMRKFDIFNYQKMYTIGFLQLKDPPQSSSSSKSPITEFTTLFGQSFMTNKGKKQENDPTTKFIKELQSDLEVVYVGQMCLSWEILHWQYEKALDIWESDTRGVRRFNDIAGEFQQFQVLMQRFIEDEPFQGPRIQNYVKNRCVFRNLLQVPVIRDDHMKNKKARSEVVYDITSDALVEILEESIRIFWRFVRADKHKRQTPVEFQRPEDSQLFLDLQKDLHKKEKKLKEQLRSGNCILKKLRSCKEDETEDQVLYFFCQVDMKLVSRVLQMARLTSDQLIWCHNKLSKVSFVNTKIHVEPSFLLFPC